MNQPPTRTKAKSPLSARLDIESGVFSPASLDTASSLFIPLHYESGYAYPLVVWLHGRGDDERQLMRVMPMISMRNYMAIGLRGTTSEPGKKGYGWSQSEESVAAAEQRIFDSIDAIRMKYHVAKRRIFLAGFDCGGTMAYRVALAHPGRFAGVLSLCGPFPEGTKLLGNLGELRQLPLFLAVGRDSDAYPPEQVCDNLRLFHTAGLSITLRQYPCGQELAPQMLSDVDRWMIEQITSGDRCATESESHWSAELE